MAWRQIRDKSLSGPMLAEVTDAYTRHQGGDELTVVELFGCLSVIFTVVKFVLDFLWWLHIFEITPQVGNL